MPREQDLPTITEIEDDDFVRTDHYESGIITSSKITKKNLLPQYILLTDTKAANTAGGTFTSGSFVTRAINTENYNPSGLASLAANQITLVAGTYRVRISCPANSVNRHKALLYNITSASDQLIGTSETASSSAPVTSRSIIAGIIELASPTVFEVRHRCQTTAATSGFGLESNFGVVEVYTVAEFWKL